MSDLIERLRTLATKLTPANCDCEEWIAVQQAADELTRLRSLVDQSGGGEPAAYLIEWVVNDDRFPSRKRVQLTRDVEPWLKRLNPTITPLFASPPHGGRILEGWRSISEDDLALLEMAVDAVITTAIEHDGECLVPAYLIRNLRIVGPMLSAAPVSPLREGADG